MLKILQIQKLKVHFSLFLESIEKTIKGKVQIVLEAMQEDGL